MPSRTTANTPVVSLEQLSAAARACPAFAAARTLAEWVGGGRPVTARGVIKPAAAVEACEVLGIKVQSRKPRSALDIDELMLVWMTASAAGFIEVETGRVTAGPSLRLWQTGPADAVVTIWGRGVLECLGLGDAEDDGDLESLAVLATLHERGGSASLGELGAGIRKVIGDVGVDCQCPDCTTQGIRPNGTLRPSIERDFGIDLDLMNAEEALAVLGEYGVAVLRVQVAELTPLGRWLTDFMFVRSAPPAEADAATLVDALIEMPPMVAGLMARPWLAARAPAVAVRELLAFGESTSGQERMSAVTLARTCGADARPAWKQWAAKKGFGAYARIWLAEQNGDEPDRADQAWIIVDALAALLEELPPELPAALLASALQDQAGADQADLVPLLEGCDHPDAPRILDLLSARPVLFGDGLAGWFSAEEPLAPAQDRVISRVPIGQDVADPVPAAPRRKRPPGPGYQIKVQLRGVTKPPVWRRLHVPADIRLDDLHQVIQAAMGWEDYHIHVFSDGRTEYGVRDVDLDHQDESKIRLSRLLTSPGDKISYTYDFGDNWDHDIVLEEILPADAPVTSPVCTAGKGACPPEDCGGPWGYRDLKATLADPDAEEHDDMLDWLGLASGDDFDPTEFSLEEANHALDSVY